MKFEVIMSLVLDEGERPASRYDRCTPTTNWIWDFMRLEAIDMVTITKSNSGYPIMTE
jgi:hypothetical protein